MPPHFGHRPTARKRRNRRVADAAPTRGADARHELADRFGDVVPSAVRSAVVGSDTYRRMMADCPEPFRRWLRGVIDRVIDTHSHEPCERPRECPTGREWWCDEHSDRPDVEFLGEVRRHGLSGAVLQHANQISDRGPDADTPPVGAIVFPVLRHQLTTPAAGTPRWVRVLAARSVVRHAPSEPDAVELLARCLSEPDEAGHHAALLLADLAPRTPGLVERLLDAMTERWFPRTEREYDDEIGADSAAQALDHLWLTAVAEPPPFPSPALVRAVRRFAGRQSDTLLRVWVGLGQQAVEDFPEPDWAALDEGWMTFGVWYALPDRIPARRRVLARLLGMADVADYVNQEFGLTPLAEVLEADPPAELSLPAVAGMLAVSRYYDDREFVLTAFAAYLDRLPARRDGWSAGDAWLASLCGRSFGQLAWAVYADWLEEQGQTDAAEQIRALHAAPTDPADSWGEVCRFISVCAKPFGEL